MRLIILLGLISVCKTQQSIEDIICPLPGISLSVSKEECDLYTSCEFTNGVCHMKSNEEAGYIVTSNPIETETGFYISLRKAVPANTLFGADIQDLIFEVVHHGDYHAHFKIYDPAYNRYEVPYPLNLPVRGLYTLYTITTADVGEPFSFNITRTETGVNVWSSVGPLIFEDQFLQITHLLPTDFLYGIGENPHTTFKRDFETRRTSAIFARDFPPTRLDSDANLYGAHPYYVNIEDDDGNTHSVLLYNSNAMEFSTYNINGSDPAVTIRTIGGIFDFHIFMGPRLEDVNVQYAYTVGKPFLPPYWALGFHLSRYGYDSIDNYRVVYERMKAAQIPWDTQTFDIDYMENRRDFTYDQLNWNGFPELIQELHDANMKVILIHDPAIAIDWDNYPPAQRGREDDIFIKWASPDLVPEDQPEGAGDYLIGYVWPNNKTAFPDFINPATTDWWANELKLFHDTLNFDGVWIDMDEPSNFGTNLNRPPNYPDDLPDWSLKCPNNTFEDPPYGTYATYAPFNICRRISDQTICMSAMQTDGEKSYLHYDVHNLYGHSETIATYKALTQELYPGLRPFIYTRSTFPGSGHYAGHWLGDNSADWEMLRMSAIGILEFNLFGIPFVGADVCGFTGEPSEELCIRWMQFGAFYPFDRNHNSHGAADQDPARPGWDIAPIVSRDVLLLRYKYLPFFYGKFVGAYLYMQSVIRPLFNYYRTDLVARFIDDQFLWGTELMVAPVLQKGLVTRNVYFPDGYWYDLVNGTLQSIEKTNQTVDAPLDKIPVYVRGGSILPFQEPALTTTESRKNPTGLTVALDADDTALGSLFWDDGISEHIGGITDIYIAYVNFIQNILSIEVQQFPEAAAGLKLETIQIFGFSFDPIEIEVNGVPSSSSSSWTFDNANNILVFKLSVPYNENLTVKFIK